MVHCRRVSNCVVHILHFTFKASLKPKSILHNNILQTSAVHSAHGTRWRAAIGLWESCGRLAAERVTARADLPGWHMLEIGNE